MRKPSARQLLLTAALAVSIAQAPAFAKGGPNRAGGGDSTVALSAVEAADLVFMREEEKLARDVYLTFDQAWGTAAFANIAASEQRHMDAMLKLLRRYKLPDPTAGNALGEFTDPELQALHDALIERGGKSELDAVQVGGFIEEADMQDIAAAIERSEHDDIDATYANLLCGSRNHLRAFAATTEKLSGEPYQAQILSQTEVDAIVGTPNERCGK